MRSKRETTLSAIPIYLFTTVFVAVPILYALVLSFMTRTNTWNVEYTFTLQNYADIFSGIYIHTFLKSLGLAALVTAITVLIGYPAGLFIAQASEKWRNFFLTAQMIPFWINSIVRLYSIIIILRADGPLGKLRLLYTYPAVVITLVYAVLPFMIYSVYSAAAKMDISGYEASRTLGAGKARAFFDVTLPLTSKGLLSGVTLSFIPSMGLFFIPNLFGGGKVQVFGNLIEDQLMKVHNLPLAAALSVFLMLLTGAIVALTNFLDPVELTRKHARRKDAQIRKGGAI